MNGTLFECSWGGIRLFASRIEWEAGNTQVVHEPASGDVHPVQPRGQRHRRARVDLLFDDFPNAELTGLDAYRAFSATSKERRLFTHPIDGSFYAVIGEMQVTADVDQISCSVEIHPDEPVSPVSPASAASIAASGEDVVGQATERVALKMSEAGIGFSPDFLKKMDFTKSIDFNIKAAFGFSASLGLSAQASASASAAASGTASVTASAQASASASAYAFASVYATAFAAAAATAVVDASASASASAFAFAYASANVQADANASVSSWSQDEETTPTKIDSDVARLSASLEDMIEFGRLEEELDLFPVLVSMIQLGESVRTAAISASAETDMVFLMRVSEPTSLMPLCARIYGGSQAQRRARQIGRLNPIRTVGWLEPGDYLMPQRQVTSSARLVGG